MKMVTTVINGYIGAVAMILCLAIYNFIAAVVAVAGVLLSALFLYLLGQRSRENAPVHQQAQDDMVSAILEYVRGLPIVKAYGQAGASVQNIRQAFLDSCRVNIKIEQEYVVYNCLHLLALEIASVMIIVVSAVFALEGALPLAVFLMMSIFSFTIFSQVKVVHRCQAARNSGYRLPGRF